jgi:hypothetical protein
MVTGEPYGSSKGSAVQILDLVVFQ